MKKYLSIAALLAAGTLVSNAVALTDANTTLTITSDTNTMTSDDGTFSIVLALDVTALRPYLEAGSTPAKSYLVTYNAKGNDGNGHKTGIVTNYNSSNDVIASSGIYGVWDTSDSYANFTDGTDLAALAWDDIASAGLTYTFVATKTGEASTGTSVALCLADSDGNVVANTYVYNSGLFSASAVADAITFDANVVDTVYYFNDALSETNAKALAASAAGAIPEPSAFGLLAGLGALALVASRRRRK